MIDSRSESLLVRIHNQSKKTVIAERASRADTVLSRMAGLLGRDSIASDEALIITRCKSIHMFFMRFSIGVIFVDKDNRVVGTLPAIRPFRLSPTFFKASYAIELAAGAVERSHTCVGDTIVIEEE